MNRPNTNSLFARPAAFLAVIIGVGTALYVASQTVTPPANAAKQEKTMIGQPAPAFSLPDQNDKTVKLADYKGKWVVLAFYPADMTGGCTMQNRSYTEHNAEFAAKNAVAFTVSTQDSASKREFCTRDSLTHTLLSDVGGKVAKSYDALMDNTTYANRWTYYIKPDGTIAYIDKAVSVGKAATDSLALLDKLAKEDKAK
ncbi:MAG: peroxiredoxin [Armatimonadetes bacterium]|nr:peroxiredoxin [Armatimonadota bacterium]